MFDTWRNKNDDVQKKKTEEEKNTVYQSNTKIWTSGYRIGKCVINFFLTFRKDQVT